MFPAALFTYFYRWLFKTTSPCQAVSTPLCPVPAVAGWCQRGGTVPGVWKQKCFLQPFWGWTRGLMSICAKPSPQQSPQRRGGAQDTTPGLLINFSSCIHLPPHRLTTDPVSASCKLGGAACTCLGVYMDNYRHFPWQTGIRKILWRVKKVL